MDIFQISKKGGREINEDSIGVFFSDDKKMIYLICADGLGGHGKGEEASAIAVACMEELANAGEAAECFFEKFFEEAENRIRKRQKDEQAPNDFKTTSVIAVTDGEKFRCAHIGDSRLYYFRAGKIMFRTLDHSVPQMLVLAGELKEKKIRNHPDRNRLLRVLGQNADKVRFEMSDEITMKGDDAVLLCSDGFWELIDENKMCRMLKKSSSAKEWGELMEREVLKNGKKREMDNYSAICVIVNCSKD